MEKILDTFIDEINNVIGVRSAYLVNNRGELLWPRKEPTTRSTLTASGALDLVQAMGLFEMPGEDIVEMELDFHDGKILVYHTIKINVPSKLGVQETFLLILGDRNFNKAHMRLAMNVSLANVLTSKKYKKLDQPVKIRKASLLSRDRLNEKEIALAEKVRQLLT